MNFVVKVPALHLGKVAIYGTAHSQSRELCTLFADTQKSKYEHDLFILFFYANYEPWKPFCMACIYKMISEKQK
jgi:hypothetical protein